MEHPENCTLNTPTVAPLLERLFAEAEASNAKLRQLFGAMSPEERKRRMSDPDADYREFYGRARELYLAVSPETARLLYLLARATRARAIVEFGTSFGISTVHLAAALRDNGGGRLIGSELEPTKIAQARANLGAAGLADLVDVREGDALETLARDLPETIDLVLLDGHKPLYPRILDLVAPRLRVGACLVADNVASSPDYVARVRGGREYLSVPFAEDVELSIKL
ncbi:MAG TPA: class I SAM-dependent methyltransferase [Polyangiaceae bacterium]|jgi:predicted O-methyltransferase YrrM|nr:class I SAM-dependent methyltransferase [Polyangiaceae bacterium]